MSAELLRRAAKVLREHGEALPLSMKGSWFTRAGHVVAGDGTDVGMLVVDAYQPADDGPLMAFMALMHPPVALALADLLDDAAGVVESATELAETLDVEAHEILTTTSYAVAVARVILREPEATT